MAFSIIDEQTNSEFAHWFLGHNYSVDYMDIMSVSNGQIGKFGYPFSQVDNTNLYKSFVNYNWAVIWGLMGRLVSQIFLEIILITQISKLDRAISELA